MNTKIKKLDLFINYYMKPRNPYEITKNDLPFLRLIGLPPNLLPIF